MIELISKFWKKYSLLSLFLLFFPLAACSSGPVRIPIATIYQSSHCGISVPGVQLLHEQSDLNAIVNRQQSLLLGSENNDGKAPILNANENTIVIAMGQKPSAGYSIVLTSTFAEIQNEQLIIPAAFEGV
ncbi:MAG: hypothetical protein P8077_08640, partial [Gammaproteobacteria bacterium]